MTAHDDRHTKAVALQLRALADFMRQPDSDRALVAEASRAVARDLQDIARVYVPGPNTGRR